MQSRLAAQALVTKSIFKRVCYSFSLGVVGLAFPAPAFAEFPGLQQTLTVDLKDPVVLDIAVPIGNVTVEYSRDGQVSIYASALDATGKSVPTEFFNSNLTIDQAENHITIRSSLNPVSPDAVHEIRYTISVPSLTEVTSTISGAGNQLVIGVSGPAKIVTGVGDIDASYVRGGLKAETGKGKISCTRVGRVEAVTGSGNITLMEDGASNATVKKGFGRIEVGGARAGFTGSTDKGDLHIKAVLQDDWLLNSVFGNIRIELPPKAQFKADIASTYGDVEVERAVTDKLNTDACRCQATVNDGSAIDQSGKHLLCEQGTNESIPFISDPKKPTKHIQARSGTGNIFLD